MQERIALEVVSALSEKGFTLDELVVKTKGLFETEGMAGFIGLLLRLVDEMLSVAITRGESRLRPEGCCGFGRYEVSRRSRKRFRTSVGEVKIFWRRIRCTRCGSSFIPLREFLGVQRHQAKSAELERIVAEVVSEQSYRRTSRHLGVIGEIPVPKSTAHRWVMESSCDELQTRGKHVQELFADGTGYKERIPGRKEGKNPGEIRVVVGATKDGTLVPFGAWSGVSWQEIGQQIKKKRKGGEAVAELLISDGEAGLAEGLAHLANEHQRCHWHSIHDLSNVLWQDWVKRRERRQWQKELAGIIGIELPREDFEDVAPEDKARIELSAKMAERQLDNLVQEFLQKGYKRAANYIVGIKDRLFTYVRFWLAHGLVSPRVTSWLERLMREIGRRLKRIAFGWSKRGAAKMTRIIIKRITDPVQWEAYWQKRFGISGNVALVFRGAYVL